MKNILNYSLMAMLFLSLKSFANVEINFASTPECANSKNGTITITFSVNQQVPLPQAMPYPMPYEVTYVNEYGDFGEDIMLTNPHVIRFVGKGHYKITIYYNDQCYSEGEVDVLETTNNLIVTPTIQNVSCEMKGKISLIASGGSAPYNFEWENGNNTNKIENLEYGEYCYKVIDVEGCMQEDCEYIFDERPDCFGAKFNYEVSDYLDESHRGSIIDKSQTNIEAEFIWFCHDNGFSSKERNVSNLKPGKYCLRVLCCNNIIFENCWDIHKKCDVISMGDQTIDICEPKYFKIEINDYDAKKNSHSIYLIGQEESSEYFDQHIWLKKGGNWVIRVVSNEYPFCYEEINLIVNDKRTIKNYDIQISTSPAICSNTLGNFTLNINNLSGWYWCSTKHIESNVTRIFNSALSQPFNLPFPGNYEYELLVANGGECPLEKFYGNLFIQDDGNKTELKITTKNATCIENGEVNISPINLNTLKIKIADATIIPRNYIYREDLVKDNTKQIKLSPGYYVAIDEECFRETFFTIGQNYSNLQKTITIGHDDIETIEPEGHIIVDWLDTDCTLKNFPQKYILSQNPNLSCEDVDNTGLKVKGGGFEIYGLKPGKYYLYLSCSGCCSKDEIIIEMKKSPIKVIDDCGKTLKIEGFPNCYIIWPGHGSGYTCDVKEDGVYTAWIYLPPDYIQREIYSKYISKKPIINVLQNKCIGLNNGQQMFIEVENFPNYQYLWSTGSNISNSGWTDPYPTQNYITLTITDTDSDCKEIKKFEALCCNSHSCAKVQYKMNPSGNQANGVIKMDCDNNNCTYKWKGPNGFERNGCEITNLKAGDYYSYVNGCGSPTKISLRDCEKTKFNINYSYTRHCIVYDEIEIEFTIDEESPAPPYTVTCTNGQLIWNNENKFRFKGIAGNFDGRKSLLHVTNSAGCEYKYYFTTQTSYSELLKKDLSKNPPICEFEYYCEDKKIKTKNAFSSEVYDPVNCTLQYICNGETVYSQGYLSNTIIHNKETNECIKIEVCEFSSGTKKKQYSRGEFENIPCPPEGGLENDTENGDFGDLERTIVKKWPKFGGDIKGCYKYESYKDVSTGNYIKFIFPLSQEKFYCVDEDGNCREEFSCGAFKIGLPPNRVNWVEEFNYWKDELVNIEKCNSANNTPLCASRFKKDCPDKFLYHLDSNKFITFLESDHDFKIGFYNGNGIYNSDYNTYITLNTTNESIFEIVKVIPTNLGYSIFANTKNIESIGGQVQQPINNFTILKLDYDINGNRINIASPINNVWNKLLDVIPDQNGGYIMVVQSDPNLNSSNDISSSINIVICSENNNIIKILNIPNQGDAKSAELIQSSSNMFNLKLIKTENDINTILNYSFNQLGVNINSTQRIIQGELLKTKTININGTPYHFFNSKNDHGYSKIEFYSTMQNANSIGSFGNSSKLELVEVLPDIVNGGFYIIGNFSDTLVCPDSSLLISPNSDIFIMKYNDQSVYQYSIKSSSVGLGYVKDALYRLDGSIVLLGTYYGENMSINGRNYNGSNTDCNTAIIILYPQGIIHNQNIHSRVVNKGEKNKIINVYPNPTNGLINITAFYSGISPITLELRSISGITLIKREIKPTLQGLIQEVINIKDFPNGIYILSAYDTSRKLYINKIVKN